MTGAVTCRSRSEGTARYDKRLAEILGIAARLMAKQGYEKTSVRQVARSAKVALSGLYYYIGGKEDLLFLIQFHTFDALVRELERRLPTTASPEASLQAVIDTHLDHFLKHMDDLKVCARELETLTGKPYRQVLSLRRQYFAMTLAVVQELVEKNGVHVDPQIATLSLFGALNWMYQWYTPKRKVAAGQLKRELTQLFLNALGSDEHEGTGTGRRETRA